MIKQFSSASDGTDTSSSCALPQLPGTASSLFIYCLMYLQKLKDDVMNGCYCSSKLEKERGFAFEEYKP